MSTLTILVLVILVIAVFASLAYYPRRSTWGTSYYIGPLVAIILVVLLVLLLTGRV